MSEWIEKKLSDVSDVIGGSTPSTKNNEYYGGDIPWLTPKDLSGYNYKRISKGERNITKLGLEKSSAKTLPKNTVLFTSRAPIGYVAIASNEVTTNQGFKSLILKDGNNPDFFYYLLKHNVPLIEARASGSTFKEVSGQILKDTMLSIPDADTQIKIAKILSSLDDKIENNRRMNETLEGMAQAVFKSWFVDFDPVHAKVEALKNGCSEDGLRLVAMRAISGKTADALTQLKSENPDDYAQLAQTADAFPSSFNEAGLPEEWQMEKLGKIADLKQGKYLSDISDTQNLEYPYPAFGGGNIRGYVKKYDFEYPEILVTCRGSGCGLLQRSYHQSAITNSVIAIKPFKKVATRSYIFYLSSLLDFLSVTTGSAQPQITISNLSTI